MRRLCVVMPMMLISLWGKSETYEYRIENGEAIVTSVYGYSNYGDLLVPEALGGCPVTEIGNYALVTSAFYVKLPSTLRKIGKNAFRGCQNLGEVVFNNGLEIIDEYAFAGCINLTQIYLPKSLKEIKGSAFWNSYRLSTVNFFGEQPVVGANAFLSLSSTCKFVVSRSKSSWASAVKSGSWQGYAIRYFDQYNVTFNLNGHGERVGGGELEQLVEYKSLPVEPIVAEAPGWTFIGWDQQIREPYSYAANVYTAKWAQNYDVVVSGETTGGQTLILNGAWTQKFGYAFESKFGSDVAAAFVAKTGKKDAENHDLYVWQDYVAGTDPTDVTSTFKATITMVGGVPDVQWDPVLMPSEAEKRTYRKFGKVRLQDGWVEIPAGKESDYNFFKVTVEMKK